MPYTPSFTFVDNTPLSAPDIEQNFQDARDYINGEIQSADIEPASLDSSDLQEGEFMAVTDDFVFPVTGDMLSDFFAVRTSQVYQRLYISGTVKKHKPQETSRFISLYGKEFYLEKDATVHFSSNAFCKANTHDMCRGNWYPWNNAPGQSGQGWHDLFYVAVDGVVQGTSVNYSFNEVGTTFSPGSVVDLNVPDPSSLVTGRRRFLTLQHTAYLTRGWHKMQVVANPNNEANYVSQRTMQVEVFYDAGPSTNTSTNSALNQSYPTQTY